MTHEEMIDKYDELVKDYTNLEYEIIEVIDDNLLRKTKLQKGKLYADVSIFPLRKDDKVSLELRAVEYKKWGLVMTESYFNKILIPHN